MAHVYQVEHAELGTIHALKVHCETETDESGTSDYYSEIAHREARFLTTLKHNSLPRVTDLFREGSCIFLVMDYIEGENLKQIVERAGNTRLDVAEVLDWGIQICDVLDYLHNQKPPVIFRDLKPSNIIRRPDNTLCLVDFGIARTSRQGVRVDTVVLGSPGYAPPEQYGQDQTTPLSDIYAFGATMHHLLTGRDPSTAPFQWPDIHDFNPLVPLALERLVMRCLAVDPNNRPESAQAIGSTLRRLREQMTPRAPSLATPQKPSEPEAAPALEASATPPIQVMPTIILPRELLEKESELDTTPNRSLQLSTPPPIEVPRSIPATFTPRRATPMTHTKPEEPAAKTPLNLGLAVRICASLALIGSLSTFPVTLWQEPKATAPAPPPPLPTGALPEERAEYTHRTEVYEAAKRRDERARESFHRFTPLRYALAVLTAVAFLIGGVLNLEAARWRLGLVMAGVLGMIILTGLFLLPAQMPIFLVLVALEALMLVPTLFLFISPEMQ